MVDTILATFGTLTFASFGLLFLAIAILQRSRAFAFLATAAAAALTSGIADGLSSNTSNGALFEVATILALVSGFFMLKGLSSLVPEEVSLLWKVLPFVAYFFRLCGKFADLPFSVHHAPVTLAIFAFYLATARVTLRLPISASSLKRVAAATMFVNGLYSLLYVFVRLDGNAWLFAGGVFLSTIMLVSFIIVHFSVEHERVEKARAVLNTYIEDSPIGIAVTNSSLLVARANTALTRIVGVPESSLIRKSFTTILAPESAENFSDFVCCSQNGRMTKELLFLNKNQERVPCRVAVTQQDDGSFLFFCDDISEEKLSEHSQNELRQLVFHSSQMASLGELAASVAHEINTPLAVVSSTAELTQAALKNKSATPEYLNNSILRINTGAKRINSIVRSLLSLSRKTETTATTVDLRECIEDTLNFINVLMAKHRIRIDVRLGEVPLHVHVRPNEINQILTNLITNARDAVEKEADKAILVKCVQENGFVTLSVKDSGCGMKPEVAHRIFENFFTTKGAGHGNGLGLSISKRMAETNGGTLTFSTTPGAGSTFMLTLPLVEAPPQTTCCAEERPAAKRKRVLVVDDEPAILEVLCEFLASEGYQATCASTLAEARNKISSTNFDFVFTDYVLDFGTGEDVLLECRKRYSRDTCRVFLLSGQTQDENIDVDGHLRKPFNLDDVKSVLKNS